MAERLLRIAKPSTEGEDCAWCGGSEGQCYGGEVKLPKDQWGACLSCRGSGLDDSIDDEGESGYEKCRRCKGTGTAKTEIVDCTAEKDCPGGCEGTGRDPNEFGSIKKGNPGPMQECAICTDKVHESHGNFMDDEDGDYGQFACDAHWDYGKIKNNMPAFTGKVAQDGGGGGGDGGGGGGDGGGDGGAAAGGDAGGGDAGFSGGGGEVGHSCPDGSYTHVNNYVGFGCIGCGRCGWAWGYPYGRHPVGPHKHKKKKRKREKEKDKKKSGRLSEFCVTEKHANCATCSCDHHKVMWRMADALQRYCPNCDASNLVEAQECSNCGDRLAPNPFTQSDSLADLVKERGIDLDYIGRPQARISREEPYADPLGINTEWKGDPFGNERTQDPASAEKWGDCQFDDGNTAVTDFLGKKVCEDHLRYQLEDAPNALSKAEQGVKTTTGTDRIQFENAVQKIKQDTDRGHKTLREVELKKSLQESGLAVASTQEKTMYNCERCGVQATHEAVASSGTRGLLCDDHAGSMLTAYAAVGSTLATLPLDEATFDSGPCTDCGHFTANHGDTGCLGSLGERCSVKCGQQIDLTDEGPLCECGHPISGEYGHEPIGDCTAHQCPCQVVRKVARVANTDIIATEVCPGCYQDVGNFGLHVAAAATDDEEPPMEEWQKHLRSTDEPLAKPEPTDLEGGVSGKWDDLMARHPWADVQECPGCGQGHVTCTHPFHGDQPPSFKLPADPKDTWDAQSATFKTPEDTGESGFVPPPSAESAPLTMDDIPKSKKQRRDLESHGLVYHQTVREPGQDSTQEKRFKHTTFEEAMDAHARAQANGFESTLQPIKTRSSSVEVDEVEEPMERVAALTEEDEMVLNHLYESDPAEWSRISQNLGCPNCSGTGSTPDGGVCPACFGTGHGGGLMLKGGSAINDPTGNMPQWTGDDDAECSVCGESEDAHDMDDGTCPKDLGAEADDFLDDHASDDLNHSREEMAPPQVPQDTWDLFAHMWDNHPTDEFDPEAKPEDPFDWKTEDLQALHNREHGKTDQRSAQVQAPEGATMGLLQGDDGTDYVTTDGGQTWNKVGATEHDESEEEEDDDISLFRFDHGPGTGNDLVHSEIHQQEHIGSDASCAYCSGRGSGSFADVDGTCFNCSGSGQKPDVASLPKEAQATMSGSGCSHCGSPDHASDSHPGGGHSSTPAATERYVDYSEFRPKAAHIEMSVDELMLDPFEAAPKPKAAPKKKKKPIDADEAKEKKKVDNVKRHVNKAVDVVDGVVDFLTTPGTKKGSQASECSMCGAPLQTDDEKDWGDCDKCYRAGQRGGLETNAATNPANGPNGTTVFDLTDDVPAGEPYPNGQRPWITDHFGDLAAGIEPATCRQCWETIDLHAQINPTKQPGVPF